MIEFISNSNGEELFLSFLLTPNEYSLLLSTVLEEHKKLEKRRDEQHLRLLDSLATVKPITGSSSVFILIPIGILTSVLRLLLCADTKCLQTMVARNHSVGEIQQISSTYHSLIEKVEALYVSNLRLIYGNP